MASHFFLGRHLTPSPSRPSKMACQFLPLLKKWCEKAETKIQSVSRTVTGSTATTSMSVAPEEEEVVLRVVVLALVLALAAAVAVATKDVAECWSPSRCSTGEEEQEENVKSHRGDGEGEWVR